MKNEPITPKHETAAPPKPVPPKSFSDTLSELGAHLKESPDRRALAVFALGAVLKMALDAGWHEQELAALRAWPR